MTGAPRFTPAVGAATWFAVWIVTLVGLFVVFGAAGFLGKAVEDLPPWATVISATAGLIPTLVGLRYVSRRYATNRFRDDYGLSFRLVDLVGLPLGVLCQVVLLEGIYWPLRSAFPDTFSRDAVEKPGREILERVDGGWQIAVIAMVIVGAPIIEELMYRGLILRSLDGRIRDSLAVVASAVWFALIHGRPILFPGLFVFGVVLALCAQRTGRLGSSIVAHAAFNATATVMLLR